MTQRRLNALRALAERPGTEAEGQVAREKLKAAEAQRPQLNRIKDDRFNSILEQHRRDLEEMVQKLERDIIFRMHHQR